MSSRSTSIKRKKNQKTTPAVSESDQEVTSANVIKKDKNALRIHLEHA